MYTEQVTSIDHGDVIIFPAGTIDRSPGSSRSHSPTSGQNAVDSLGSRESPRSPRVKINLSRVNENKQISNDVFSVKRRTQVIILKESF